MSGVKRAVGAVVTGVLALSLAAGVGLAGLLLPDSDLARPEMALNAGAVSSSEGRAAMVCLGGIERSVATGVNVAQADEKIRSFSGALLTGVTPAVALTRWQTLTGKTPAKATAGGSSGANGSTSVGSAGRDTGNAVTTAVIDGAFTSKTGLGTAALTGAASINRAAGQEALLMGGTAHVASAGDLRGLAYVPCAWPTNSLWLVGSASTVGTSNRLVLSNPTLTSVQVKIRAFTSLGEASLGTSSLVALPPQTIRSISLDGLVNDDDTIAFFLAAEAGQFTAALQTNTLSGFTPAGIDMISAGREGRSVVIPGLVLPAGNVNLGGIKSATETGKSALVDSAVKAGVRIVNPSDQMLIASVELIGADGKARALSGGSNVKLISGGVLELSLDGVQPGAYAVRVSADGPVAAGAFVRYDAGAAGKDVAWLASQGTVTNAGAAVGIGTAQLVVVPALNTNQVREAAFTWKAFDAKGKQIAEKKVSAKGTVAVALPSGTAYVSVNSAAPVYAAISGQADLGNGVGIAWAPLSQTGANTSTTRVLFAN
ncbi:MAG: DUF5719 family protein [Actinomycetaceae bacterium]|nr:DUF5719 family protein [Arcanobacterium sp.]MDD7687684.1 DUF5719 family protein [Actinomycetaceae bacterium]MDY5273925.1 DUF5719 family protein [Arcanobacterium sp.]